MKEAIDLKKKELAILEAMALVGFSNLPVDTLCRVSDNLSNLAAGKGDMRYFYYKAANGALCFYRDGADSKTQVAYTNYKYVVVVDKPPVDFRQWLKMHRTDNMLKFEMQFFPKSLPKNYLTILEEETYT